MLADNTGQTKERIIQDFDRDKHMTAAQAVEYGFIDKIIEKRSDAV